MGSGHPASPGAAPRAAVGGSQLCWPPQTVSSMSLQADPPGFPPLLAAPQWHPTFSPPSALGPPQEAPARLSCTDPQRRGQGEDAAAGAGSSCHRDSISGRQLGLHLQSWPPPRLPSSPWGSLRGARFGSSAGAKSPCTGEPWVGVGGKRWMLESIAPAVPDGWRDGRGLPGRAWTGARRRQRGETWPDSSPKAKVWAAGTRQPELRQPLLALRPSPGRERPKPPQIPGGGTGSTFCPR